MTEPRHHCGAPRRLDDLLSRLPTPGGEPTSAEWATRLARTLQEIQAVGGSDGDENSAEDLIRRTPLPVESGEPEPTNPFRFDAEQGAIYDELRAPLKSGEHAPLRLTEGSVEGAEPEAPNAQLIPIRPARAREWLYWLSGSMGALAAAAAMAMMVNEREPIQVGQTLTPMRTARGLAAASESNLPTTATSQPEDQNLATEDHPFHATKTEALPTKGVATQARASSASPAVTETAALEEVKAPSEPPLVPAAGPSNLPEHPSIGAINAALSSGVPMAQRCLSSDTPTASVRITFQSDGSVQRMQFATPDMSSEIRACIQRAFGKVRVEPFARSQFEVNRTISLPSR